MNNPDTNTCSSCGLRFYCECECINQDCECKRENFIEELEKLGFTWNDQPDSYEIGDAAGDIIISVQMRSTGGYNVTSGQDGRTVTTCATPISAMAQIVDAMRKHYNGTTTALQRHYNGSH